MKKKYTLFLAIVTLLSFSSPVALFSASEQGVASQATTLPWTGLAVVNTKRCLEESKLGQFEKANFEKMKNQMESVLKEKGEVLEEIEKKVNDEDYMDIIAEEAAAELKRKKRTLKQEAMQLQNQYMQMLQQANMKVVQLVIEEINKASEEVAKEAPKDRQIAMIISDEAATYVQSQYDVTTQIIAKMDERFEKNKPEAKEMSIPK